MSEKLTNRSTERPLQSHEAAEISRKNIERIIKLAEKEKQPTDTLESLQATVRHEALAAEELQPPPAAPKQRPVYEQQLLKQQAFDKTMDRVRMELSPVERQFSKVLHQKTVEKVSSVGSVTLARPSGILGGGLAAALGSGVILYYANHLGFTYNYTILILLYIVGFIGGVGVEFLARVAAKRSK